MRHTAFRSALLMGSALAASPALADSAESSAAAESVASDAQPERSYLPAEIVVSEPTFSLSSSISAYLPSQGVARHSKQLCKKGQG